MFFLLILLVCLVNSYSQDSLPVCDEFYKLDIAFNKDNVPKKFFFTEKEANVTYTKTLSPILQAIDYDGIVQFKSSNGMKLYRISYVDPGEEKKLDEKNLLPLNALQGVIDSVSVSDMWGVGSLFNQYSFFKEKWQELRFLIPVFEKRNEKNVQRGYACTNWFALRKVPKPRDCLKREKNISTPKKTTGNDSLYSNPELWNQIQSVLDCYEQ